ncbi:MAG: cytochrome c [Planctomycetota bacterium]
MRTTLIALVLMVAVVGFADEKRAPAPTFDKSTTDGVFFNDLSEAFRGKRPSLQSLRQTKRMAAAPALGLESKRGEATGGPWDELISPSSIEDEIKRLRLHYDTVVTQPGPFKSGGYEEARLDLMVMSSLFAVITEYGGDVRWKKDAPAARDLFARTAFNCNAGTTQVFNEAKTRKDDLQDLMSGSGLRGRKAEDGNDWTAIVDRSPMMEYADYLHEELRQATNDENALKSEPENALRPAELLAVLGKILVQEGMDESDDEDYVALTQAMTDAAVSVKVALERQDYEAARKAVGAITQSCDACHEQYR